MCVNAAAVLLSIASTALKPGRSFNVYVDGSDLGGYVSEVWANASPGARGTSVIVQGNSRLYAVAHVPDVPAWEAVEYRRFELLDRAIAFDVDLSNIGCGCNAAVYLVDMRAPEKDGAGYCDIQGVDASACLEVDLLEGNIKAIQTTVHTTEGHGLTDNCNQDGCVGSIGSSAATAHLYGPGVAQPGIDSSRPFTVTATFTDDGEMSTYDVVLSQEPTPQDLRIDTTAVELGSSSGGGSLGRSVHFFDSENAAGSHAPDGLAEVPIADRVRMADALRGGLVLVLSLWSGEHANDMSWLDGGCDDWVARGHSICEASNLARASFTVSNVRTSAIPSPPPPPPPNPPPPAPPALLAVSFTAFAPWAVVLVLSIVLAVQCMRRKNETRADAPKRRKRERGRAKVSHQISEADEDPDECDFD